MDIADPPGVSLLDLVSGGAAGYAEQAPAVDARHDQASLLREGKELLTANGYPLSLVNNPD
jgi:hypothetical protein